MMMTVVSGGESERGLVNVHELLFFGREHFSARRYIQRGSSRVYMLCVCVCVCALDIYLSQATLCALCITDGELEWDSFCC